MLTQMTGMGEVFGVVHRRVSVRSVILWRKTLSNIVLVCLVTKPKLQVMIEYQAVKCMKAARPISNLN